MHGRRDVLSAICLALALIGTTSASAQMPDLIATVSARLGVTREQSAGGVGAVFRLAEQRLSPAEFSIIAGSLPGVDGVLDAAPAVAASAGGIDDLAAPFALLGMPSALIPPFVAIVLDYAGAQGSEPVAGLLRRTLVDR
jgi:hypothetical protein